MNRTPEQRKQFVNGWIDTLITYFIKYNGEVKGKKDMWNECLHSKTNQDFADWVEEATQACEEHFDMIINDDKLNTLFHDIAFVQTRIKNNEPVVEKHTQGYNRFPWRGLFAHKDLQIRLNKLKTPVESVKEIKSLPYNMTKKQLNKAEHFESLFEIEDIK